LSATCFHVEFGAILACFRVARVCRRQLGFLVLQCWLSSLLLCTVYQHCKLVCVIVTMWLKSAVVDIAGWPLGQRCVSERGEFYQRGAEEKGTIHSARDIVRSCHFTIFDYFL